MPFLTSVVVLPTIFVYLFLSFSDQQSFRFATLLSRIPNYSLVENWKFLNFSTFPVAVQCSHEIDNFRNVLSTHRESIHFGIYAYCTHSFWLACAEQILQLHSF